MVWLLSRSDRRIGILLDNPVCHFFSAYSYEIYLWQYPVLFVAGLLGMEQQYLLQTAVLLLLSVWNHELIAFLQRLSARIGR
jgi:peptidoglycan/LPS O-acetylase OafA/YrhL